ncbi:hypothetical protein OC844_006293, partial [Tilletia horrida]
MPSADRAAPWQAPVPLGIPGTVLQQAPALAGAYRNSGKMTAGLASLQAATSRTVEASMRNTRIVESLHSELANGLKQLEANLKKELAEARQTVAVEMDRVQAHIHSNVVGDVSKMVARLGMMGGDGHHDVSEAADALKQCAQQVEQDILRSEAGFMDNLAHLVVYNSWTTAWPEA